MQRSLFLSQKSIWTQLEASQNRETKLFSIVYKTSIPVVNNVYEITRWLLHMWGNNPVKDV